MLYFTQKQLLVFNLNALLVFSRLFKISQDGVQPFTGIARQDMSTRAIFLTTSIRQQPLLLPSSKGALPSCVSTPSSQAFARTDEYRTGSNSKQSLFWVKSDLMHTLQTTCIANDANWAGSSYLGLTESISSTNYTPDILCTDALVLIAWNASL